MYFCFSPVESRYNNEVKVGDKELIVNTEIFNHQFVNREATVLSTPIATPTPVNPGDKVLIHHNVFRRYYNLQGQAVDSSKTFDDNKYFCQYDQIYLYKRMVKWIAVGERCFIMPIKNNNAWSQEPEQKNKGILKIGNKTLESLGIYEGDLVGFKSNREFEFIVDKQRLYCMQSNDILVKYEFKGNEEEYNPSWAKSS